MSSSDKSVVPALTLPLRDTKCLSEAFFVISSFHVAYDKMNNRVSHSWVMFFQVHTRNCTTGGAFNTVSSSPLLHDAFNTRPSTTSTNMMVFLVAIPKFRCGAWRDCTGMMYTRMYDRATARTMSLDELCYYSKTERRLSALIGIARSNRS